MGGRERELVAALGADGDEAAPLVGVAVEEEEDGAEVEGAVAVGGEDGVAHGEVGEALALPGRGYHSAAAQKASASLARIRVLCERCSKFRFHKI